MPNNSYLNFYYDKQADVTNYYLQPFTIHILEDQTRVYLTGTFNLMYSYDDGVNWITHSANGASSPSYIYGPHGNPTYFLSGERIIFISLTPGSTNFKFGTNNKTFNISGNIMSLYGNPTSSIKYTHPTYFNTVNFSFQFMFMGSQVVDARQLYLPATKLTYPGAYIGMFQNCSFLKYGPDLPATTLSNYCYSGMFEGCASLEDCPALPATTLSSECYRKMFKDCISLRMTCELPATTLTSRCYEEMFNGCTSLLQMPNLPATSLAERCYEGMFNGCTSLTIPKELPATTLAERCYASMFYGCTSLMRAPDLNAPTLPLACYQLMFSGCTSLNYIKCLATSKNNTSLSYWVNNVAASGTFVKDINAVTDRDTLGSTYFWKVDDVNGIPIGWTIQNDGAAEVGGVTISVTTDPDSSGIIYGAGTYTLGATCQLTASANTGYRFVGWYIGESLLSANSIYSFTVSSSLNIKAKFEEYEITYYTVRWGKTYDNVINWSDITQYAEGTEVTITAPAWPAVGGNYVVSAWYEKSPNEAEWTNLETDAQSYTFTVTQDVDIYTRYEFVEDTDANYIKLSASPRGYGQYNISFEGTSETTSEDKTYLILPGVQVTITAIPSVGYEFDYWQLNGINYSTDTTVTFTPTQDFYLTAMFKDPDINYRYEYFTIESLEKDCGVWINIYEGEHFLLQFSENYGQWREVEIQYDSSTASFLSDRYYNSKMIAILGAGGNIRLRCNRGVLESANYATNQYGDAKAFNRFSITKKFNVKGNLYSLVSWEEGHVQYVEPSAPVIKDNAFAYMFYFDKNLISSEHLVIYPMNPGKSAFRSMFVGCENMTKTMNNLSHSGTASESCYTGMFQGCTSLTKAPYLSGSLSPYIYHDMFSGCTSLSELRNTSLSPSLAEGCYMLMFYGCVNLKHAPALPATTMAKEAYYGMFYGCYRLQEAPDLLATILAEDCYSYMFAGCVSINFAPVLPATTLANGCYSNMFDGCNNLCYIKILSTDTDYAEKLALNEWAGNVASKGNFIKASSMTYPLDSASGVPVGWTLYNHGASDEPSPIIINDKVLLTECSLENIGEEEQWWFWYQDGTPEYTDVISSLTWSEEGATINVEQGGHGYLPQWNVLKLDEDVTLEQGHNYKLVVNCKISDIGYYDGNLTSNRIRCNMGNNETWMQSDFYVFNTNDEFIDLVFDFPNWHDDNHTDPDDCVGPMAMLQFHYFKGKMTVRNTKLYEYGIDAEEPDTRYAINVQYNELRGIVTGAGYYDANTTVTLTATPRAGYIFLSWVKDGVIVSESTTLTFTALENATYQAAFEIDEQESSNYNNRYLTIEAIDDELDVYFGGFSGQSWESSYDLYGESFIMSYSKNHQPWLDVTIPATSTLNSGTKICTLYRGDTVRLHANASSLRLKTNPSNSSYDNYHNRQFTITNGTTTSRFKVYGNILSLVDVDSVMSTSPNLGHPIVPNFNNVTMPGTYTFSYLFSKTKLNDISNLKLPTSLTQHCYDSMFYGCKGITNIPSTFLSATTLTDGCYETMFCGTSITSIPSGLLPATTLANWCYANMFAGCTGITSISSGLLPATSLANWCYSSMFARTGITSIPSGLLPVTTITQHCYDQMFYECTSLTTVPNDLLPATTLAINCYQQMFEGCTSLTTAPDLPASTLADWCYYAMFKGCVLLTTAPDLLASTLTYACYHSMFYGCSSLNYVKCLRQTNAGQSIVNWLYGVSETGTFVKHTDFYWQSGIPEGWTVIDTRS